MSRPPSEAGVEQDAKRQQTEADLAQRVPNPSIAQSCHADALHCIFAFLDLKEHAVVLRSCRDWHEAACKEPPRDLSMEIRSAALDSLCASPLRRHVAELAFIYPSRPLRLAELRQLRSLPRLTTLVVNFDAADLHSALVAEDSRERRAQLVRDALPPRLCTLTLGLSFAPEVGAEAVEQALLDALRSMTQITDLRLEDFCGDQLDLSPLLQLPLLRHLSLEWCLNLQQILVLKQLAALVSFDGGHTRDFLCSQQMTDLLTPPHRLQRLQRVDLSAISIEAHQLALLQQLPALTELKPRLVLPECWAGLHDLGRLRTLQLCSQDPFTPEQLAALGESLSALPHLSVLHLNLPEAGSGGPSLALRLPALRQLRVRFLRLPSLRFVQNSPLIEELRLFGCAEMSADDVMELFRTYAPPLLRALQLLDCVRLSAEEQAALHPPSALLPALTQLDFDI